MTQARRACDTIVLNPKFFCSMAIKKKNISNITYMPVVESINRKFALRKEKVGYKPYRGGTYVQTISGFMGGATRLVRVDDQLVKKNYFWMKKFARNSPLSSRELQLRQWFTTASQSAKATMENLAVVLKIDADFYGQGYEAYPVPTRTREGVFAGNYYSPRNWVFAVRMAQLANGEQITATTDTWF